MGRFTAPFIQTPLRLSGPDGSRHSSDQNLKDVNSEILNYCPIFVREFFALPKANSQGVGFLRFLQCLSFFPPPEKLPSLPGTEILIFVEIYVFCGHKLLRASLRAPTCAHGIRPGRSTLRRTEECEQRLKYARSSERSLQERLVRAGRQSKDRWDSERFCGHCWNEDISDALWLPPK